MPLILLFLPNLYLYFYLYDNYIILLSLFVFLFVFSILKSTKYLGALFIFFLLAPFYLVYIFLYKNYINQNHIGTIFESNIVEINQFIGGNVFLFFLVFFFWFLFSLYIFYIYYKRPIVWLHRSRYWVLFSGVFYILFLLFVNFNYITEEDNNERFLQGHDISILTDLKKTYPFGLLFSIYDFYNEQKKLNNAYEKNKNYKFYAKQNKFLKQKQLFILVIGETSRRESWGLNGYKRNTTPNLSAIDNIVNFPEMLAVSSATREAVPMILTRKTENLVYDFDFKEKSIISVFREVGFNTYWISTQQELGRHDTSTSVYAKEADKVIFLNQNDYLSEGVLDEKLIDKTQEILLSDKSNKIFIVLHTMGSHYNYKYRYSDKYDYFRPSLNNLKSYSLHNKENKKQLINSYDNSILYTDFVLNKLINTIEKQNSISFIFYISDHGENLFDGNCDKSGHGHRTKHNFEIASFIWYSKEYENKFPDKIKALKNNKNRKINQTSVFPTLVNAAAINIPNDKLERSLLKQMEEYPRIILSNINYDQVNKESICQEIP